MYRVLLLCRNNSVLSPIAEGYFRQYIESKAEVYGAGIELEKLDPVMIRVMNEDKIDVTKQKQYILSDLKHIDFDYILTFDLESETESHHFPSKSVKYHYQFDQFLNFEEDTEKEELYINLRNRIKKIIRTFIKEHFDSVKPA